MSPVSGTITRDDIEARFRELNGEVATEVESARSKLLVAGAAAVVVVITIAFLAGRRRGRSRSTVVEVRRI
ncbi:MAG TPA: hypothetical protein VGG43_03815 [Acidimicrobiales bacterium]|jgi:hypothetical protein